MVLWLNVPGLERIAEELMGRRKWKLYQESMSRNYLQPLNNNIKTRLCEGSQKERLQEDRLELKATDSLPDTNGIDGRNPTKENTREENERLRETEDRLKDWSPESKCYFCVDGKLDSEHSTHGVLVRFFSLKVDAFSLHGIFRPTIYRFVFALRVNCNLAIQ